MISLPERFLSDVDKAAQAEHRTRSDLIREALREYLLEGNDPRNLLRTHGSEKPLKPSVP